MKAIRIPVIAMWMLAFVVAFSVLPGLAQSKDKTALNKQFLQASRKGNLEQVKVLIGEGVDLNAKDDDGLTALILAAQEGYVDIVKLLVESGANVDAKDEDGETALMLSASEGHCDVIKLLLGSGADINAKDRNGCTAAWWAVSSNHRYTLKLLKANDAHISLVMYAMTGYNREIENLLASGVDINKQYQPYGQTALVQAIQHANTDTVKLLLNKGADINATEANGNTPLIAAAALGRTDIVKSLQRKGAITNEQALTWAKSELWQGARSRIMAYCEVIRMLQEAGVKDGGFDKTHEIDTEAYCKQHIGK